jgi:ABC-type bacteriocin/lantibiotic exporter with double-glycine peptidase domain
MMPVAVQPLIQPGPLDCGLAVLAMYLGRPFAEIAERASRITRAPRRGLTVAQIRRIAQGYGVRLLSRRLQGPDLDDEIAALVLVRKRTGWHWVLWFRGVVVDPADGVIHAPEAYWGRGRPVLELWEPTQYE